MTIMITLTETNATTRAATSLSMWNESATRAIELVRYPTIISTRKNANVMVNIAANRRLFPFADTIFVSRPSRI